MHWREGQCSHVAADSKTEPGLYLDKDSPDGVYASPTLPSPFPASEAILSVNVGAADSKECGVGTWVACVTPSGSWSPWFKMLRWGKYTESLGTDASDCGRVDVDTLRLVKPAIRWRYRVAWHDPERKLFIRRVALNLFADTTAATTDAEEPGDIEHDVLPVPFHSQWEIDGFPPERVCSPTALAMVVQFQGLTSSPEQMADLAYDEEHQIYGNWSMNMLAASRLGLTAWIDRGSDMGYLKAALQQKQPVIASIAYAEGALAGAPVAASKGHLVVVAGFDRQGRVVVRDPAARGKDVWLAYDPDQFARAWLGHGGVVYRIAKGAAQ